MKTSTKITLFSALLIGTLSAGAHPHPRQQKSERNIEQKGPRRRGQHARQASPRSGQQQGQRMCPGCRQRNAAPANRASRQRNPNRQYRRQRDSDSQRTERAHNRRHRMLLENFDSDGDGQLSAEERKAVREAMKERQHGKPGDVRRRPDEPLHAE